MAMLNLDFSAVQSRDPLEPGWYLARIAQIDEKTTTTGKPMLAVQYEVTATEDGEVVPGNRKVFENWVLTSEAMWKIKQVFSALGMPTEAIVDIDTDDLLGQELMLKIIQDTYQGDIRNYIKGIKAIG